MVENTEQVNDQESEIDPGAETKKVAVAMEAVMFEFPYARDPMLLASWGVGWQYRLLAFISQVANAAHQIGVGGLPCNFKPAVDEKGKRLGIILTYPKPDRSGMVLGADGKQVASKLRVVEKDQDDQETDEQAEIETPEGEDDASL